MANNTHPSSVTNNVFVPHPTSGDLVPMGMIIQQETITIDDREVSGHKVIALEIRSLSDKATLRADDLLVALDEQFILDKTTESVLNLFENRSKKFSMTFIRQQDKDATSDIAKHQTRTITIELRVDDNGLLHVDVISDVEQLLFTKFRPTQNVTMVIWQEQEVTKYLTAFDEKTVVMGTQHGKKTEEYHFKVYIYEPWIHDGDHACTFFNNKYRGLVAGKLGKDLVLQAGDPVIDPSKPVYPTDEFFYNRLTGTRIPCAYGFESVLEEGHYMTVDSDDRTLKLIKQKSVKPQLLDKDSIFCMTHVKEKTHECSCTVLKIKKQNTND